MGRGDRARHAYSQVDVICDSSHTKAFATGIARHGGKIAVERRPYRSIKDRRTVFGAEDDVNENT